MSWVDEHEPSDEEIQSVLDDLYGEIKGVRENTTPKKRSKKMDHERKGAPGRESPVISYVRSLGDYKVSSEVAEELGVSIELVRKMARNRVTQAPSYVAPFGETHVNLYTDEDIQALRDHLDSTKKVYLRDEYPFDEEGRDAT